MQYYDLTNEVVTNMSKIRAANPKISYSFPLSEASMLSLNVCEYYVDPQPDYDSMTHNIVTDGIVIRDGSAYMTWIVEEKTAEQIAAVLESESENARMQRNHLLFESDVLIVRALEDSGTISQNLKDYRQALRDLPTHANWPNLEDADWPVEP